MAFSTKLNLSCAKFEQTENTPLQLSGDTTINGSVGTISYSSHPSTMGDYPLQLTDVQYVTGVTSGLDSRLDVIEPIYVSGATGGIYKTDCHTVSLTTANEAILAAALTGATNGLTKTGRNVKLGGILTENTTLSGATFNLSLGFSSSTISDFSVNAATTTIDSGYSQRLCMGSGGTVFTEINEIPSNAGIRYAADYSAFYAPLSLITCKDLDAATSGITSCAITTANNGLTKVGQTVVLGGTLTGDTTINVSTFDLKFSSDSVQYTADYSSTYVNRSLVDAGYVTGVTSGLDSRLDIIEPIYVTGATDGICKTDNHRVGLTVVNQNILSGALTGTTGSYLGTSGRNVCLDATSTGLIGGTITGVTNGLTKVGSHDAKLGGTLSETTTLVGSEILDINVNKLNLTGATSGVTVSGSGLFLPVTIPGTGGLLCINGSNQVSQTSLSEFGGITGATNGLDTVGQDVCLGAPLTKDTEITGAFDLSLGTSGSPLDLLDVHTSGNVGITSANNLVMSLSGSTITTSDLRGLRYTADYGTTFVDSSLVTKLYVDTIATGLNPKTAVNVATTGDITLSGTQTIDGVAVVVGNRVLVKDQSDATTNGIYVVAAGAWTRATDYDFDPPLGEIANGDLIPVLTGNTQAHTVWILTTKNPITSGTALVFTMFSQLMGVAAGNGINVVAVGEIQTVSVALATNSGLEFSSTDLRIDLDANSALVLGAGGLSVNSSIAGNALDWSNGVINVNIVDINSQLGGVLSATTNGLCEITTGVVGLGGTLTQATSISGNDSNTLTYTDTAATNKRGILYADDYSASFVARSLVDKGYVTGLTSTIQGDITGLDARLDVIEPIYVTGATNGLSKSGAHLVKLGGEINFGELIDNTILIGNWDTDNSPYIYMYSAGTDAYFTAGIANPQIQFDANMDNLSMTYDGSFISIDSGDTYISRGAGGNVKLTLSNGVLQYGNDETTYVSDNYLSRLTQLNHIPSIDYVTGLTTTSGIQTANNGLTKIGTNVILGGTLTGNTTITTNDNAFTIQTITGGTPNTISINNTCVFIDAGGSGLLAESGSGVIIQDSLSHIQLNDLNTTIDIHANKHGGAGDAQVFLDGQNSCVTISGATKLLSTPTAGATSDALLVWNSTDKIVKQISGAAVLTSAITGATNGLTKTGQDVKLGGTQLSETTIIAGNSQVFSLTGLTDLNLGATTVEITGVVTLQSTPATGATTDAVLVWNSTDKQIKQIDASNLGEDNNDYSMAVVTTSTGLTTTSPYTILVNHSAAVTMTLPATPFNGQVFKIKDAANDGLSNNITVSGNGNEIDKTGATTATINTDGGALELVFNEALDKWFVLSFVN